MKKHWKAITGLIACIVVLACAVVFFVNNNTLVKDDKAVPATNYASSVSKDDFVILEIVPDGSYAQLGYMQEGQEPIDILEASKAGKASDIKEIAGDSVTLKNTISGTEYKRLSNIYDNMDEYWVQTASNSSIQSKNKYTFIDGQSFPVNNNKLKQTFNSLVGTDENVVVKTLTANELKNAAESDDLGDLLDKTDLLYVSQSYVDESQKELAKSYAKEGKNDIDPDRTFDDSDASWKAVKKIFTRVGDKEEPMPIIMDKTIYTKALSKGKNVDTVQYKLNRDVKYADDTKDSWTVADLLTKTQYVAKNNKEASNNNIFKLYLMTMFRDPAEFYNLFVESGIIEGGSYALQSGDAATYWNTYTFLPCKGEISVNDHADGNNGNFWTDTMGITLSPKDDSKWINCNAISVSNIKADTLANAKADISKIFDYTPKACMEGRSYDVLELEPAYGFNLSAAEIERLLPYTSYTKDNALKVKITKMTTAEYIGKIDDLVSNYDLVYIGNCIDGLHQKNNMTYYGAEASGDSYNKNMAGVIYAHQGAAVQFGYGYNITTLTSTSADGKSNGYAFFNKNDTGRLHFSGNDITALKKAELEEFINTGLPVVVADELVDDAKLDSPQYFNDKTNNNMRNFLKENEDKLLPLDFNYRNASGEVVKSQLERLTRQKPTLTVNSLSANGKTVSGSDLSKNQVYTFDKSSLNHKFTFSFKVDYNVASEADFIMKLYVDKNADGIYTAKERIGIKNFRANGNNVSYTFSMNPNYTGAFTWKLEVYPRNNTGMVCSQIGYSTVRFTNNNTQARTVHVLQVQAVAAKSKHATVWGQTKAQQIDLSSEKFTELLDMKLNKESNDTVRTDYDIKITTIDLQQFTYGRDPDKPGTSWEKKEDSDYYNSGYWIDENFKDPINNPNGIMYRKNHNDDNKDLNGFDIFNYDMIIFGFADSYRDAEFNHEDMAKDVQAFIDAGKSVLFSHDLTSQINNETITGGGSETKGNIAHMETTNGAGFNRWMRDAMGLDRYNQGRRAAGTTAQCNRYTTTSSGDKYGFTYTALMQYSNFDKEKSFPNDSDWIGPYNRLFINLESNNPPYPDDPVGSTDKNGITTGKKYGTNYVTCVNDGQITKYPFDLSEYKDPTTGNYPISTTHGQAYQLNVESDDVVCWFALSDNDSENGWYSASPNDVANNYYIYNKGNVTYTGVGHSKLSEMTMFEKKLFVNTIIAALRAGVEGPQPQITNGYNIPSGDEDRYVVYADVDADSTDKDFAGEEDVEFYVTDDSTDEDTVFVSLSVETDDDVYVDKTSEFELEDASGNKIKHETISKINDSSGETQVVWKVKKSDLEASDTGIRYTIKYPRSVLKDQSSQNFILYAYSNEGGNKYKIKGYQYGAVMRRALFQLD